MINSSDDQINDWCPSIEMVSANNWKVNILS